MERSVAGGAAEAVQALNARWKSCTSPALQRLWTGT